MKPEEYERRIKLGLNPLVNFLGMPGFVEFPICYYGGRDLDGPCPCVMHPTCTNKHKKEME